MKLHIPTVPLPQFISASSSSKRPRHCLANTVARGNLAATWFLSLTLTAIMTRQFNLTANAAEHSDQWRQWLVTVSAARPASRCGTETWPDLRLKWPQVDGGRLEHIRLDLTWLDSGMSTWVDFKRLETFRSCDEQYLRERCTYTLG